nr:twin-arginine translocation signal domain-containing protein [Acidobacteriota bacterium]
MADEFEEFYKSFEEPELTADEKELLAQMPEIDEFGESRRKFLGHAAAGGLGLFALQLLAQEQVLARMQMPEGAMFAPVAEENTVTVKLQI